MYFGSYHFTSPLSGSLEKKVLKLKWKGVWNCSTTRNWIERKANLGCSVLLLPRCRFLCREMEGCTIEHKVGTIMREIRATDWAFFKSIVSIERKDWWIGPFARRDLKINYFVHQSAVTCEPIKFDLSCHEVPRAFSKAVLLIISTGILLVGYRTSIRPIL